VENEQRTTYGIAEWAATLRARRTEKELAAVTAGIRECQAARRSSPQEPDVPPQAPGCTGTQSGMGGSDVPGLI
jgi:hypothetical protein